MLLISTFTFKFAKVHGDLDCMSLDIDIHGWPNLSKSIMVQLPSKRKCGRGRKKRVKVRPTNLLVNDRSNDHPCILELMTCNSILFPIFFYFV